MITIDKDIWNKAVEEFEKEKGYKPSTEKDFIIVAAVYEKLGGKFNVKESYKEGFLDEIKKWLKKYIKSPLVVGVAAYFIYKYLKKYMKESVAQSLFTAQDDDPKNVIMSKGKIWAFSNIDFAIAWAKAKGKKYVYQIHTDKYKLDNKQYIRKLGDKKVLSDNEYIVYNILDSKLVKKYSN